MSTPLYRTLLAATFFACASCNAGQLDARAALEDTKLYFTAPLRWDAQGWSIFGATALTRRGCARIRRQCPRPFRQDHDSGRKRSQQQSRLATCRGDARPTWAYATLAHDRAGYAEGKTMIEAAALTAITTEALKLATGRLRPYETSDPDAWREGGTFPRHMRASLSPSARCSLNPAMTSIAGCDERSATARQARLLTPACTMERINCRTRLPVAHSGLRHSALRDGPPRRPREQRNSSRSLRCLEGRPYSYNVRFH